MVLTFQGKSPPHVLEPLLQRELSRLRELEAKTLYPESSELTLSVRAIRLDY